MDHDWFPAGILQGGEEDVVLLDAVKVEEEQSEVGEGVEFILKNLFLEQLLGLLLAQLEIEGFIELFLKPGLGSNKEWLVRVTSH